MSSHAWTTVGLCFDVVGAILLSIEAIKVKNLETASDKLIGLLPKLERPLWFFLTTAPTTRPSRASVPFWLATIACLGGEIWLAWSYPSSFAPSIGFASYIVMALVVGYMSIAISWMMFLFVAVCIILVFGFASFALKSVVVIDRKTADGTFGIVGVTLLVLGFAFQIVGA